MENDRELQFLLMVDSELSINDLLQKLIILLSDAQQVRPKSFDWNNNWCQISENSEYDPSKVLDINEGFLYFRYKLEVSPVKTIKLESQIQAAIRLKNTLELFVEKVEICADFEDLL